MAKTINTYQVYLVIQRPYFILLHVIDSGHVTLGAGQMNKCLIFIYKKIHPLNQHNLPVN